MKISISITDFEKVNDIIDAYPERVNKASKRAVNKAAKGLETDSVKTIMETFTIRRKDLKPAIGRTMSKTREIFAEVNIRGDKVPLDKFKHNPTIITKKRPVSGVKVWVKRGTSIIQKGSFLALLTKGENDKPRIYERKGKERWPLMRSKGVAVSDMLDNGDIKTLQSSVKERFFKYFEHEMTEGFKHGRGKK